MNQTERQREGLFDPARLAISKFVAVFAIDTLRPPMFPNPGEGLVPTAWWRRQGGVGVRWCERTM
jgi:hypothetical protein